MSSRRTKELQRGQACPISTPSRLSHSKADLQILFISVKSTDFREKFRVSVTLTEENFSYMVCKFFPGHTRASTTSLPTWLTHLPVSQA